jgi:repressor LexA
MPPIERIEGRVTVPGHLMEGKGEHYVLRVVGDSMAGEGVFDGDFVIVLREHDPLDGDMCVCLVNDDATLKRYYREGPMVRLHPANPAMQPIRVPVREVQVQGVVVGMMRKFSRGQGRSGDVQA